MVPFPFLRPSSPLFCIEASGVLLFIIWRACSSDSSGSEERPPPPVGVRAPASTSLVLSLEHFKLFSLPFFSPPLLLRAWNKDDPPNLPFHAPVKSLSMWLNRLLAKGPSDLVLFRLLPGSEENGSLPLNVVRERNLVPFPVDTVTPPLIHSPPFPPQLLEDRHIPYPKWRTIPLDCSTSGERFSSPSRHSRIVMSLSFLFPPPPFGQNFLLPLLIFFFRPSRCFRIPIPLISVVSGKGYPCLFQLSFLLRSVLHTSDVSHVPRRRVREETSPFPAVST